MEKEDMYKRINEREDINKITKQRINQIIKRIKYYNENVFSNEMDMHSKHGWNSFHYNILKQLQIKQTLSEKQFNCFFDFIIKWNEIEHMEA